MNQKQKELTPVEKIKSRSRYLRGTITEGLADQITGAVCEDDTQLTKFHGIYQQDDRNLRLERQKQKLEPAYMFMVRIRAAGGICTPKQYLTIDRLADAYGNGTFKITTRQSIQLHGVLKRNLKKTIKTINDALMDTLAACGDVNRNVMCSPNPFQSEIHEQVYQYAVKLSEHLTPHTSAYHEIWLDKEKIVDSRKDHEPIYGQSYLPRKFKIAIAVPPRNDVDVLTNDLGFIAIIQNGRLEGFSVTAGGGMGMSHGEPETYPRLANDIGFCKPGQILEIAEHMAKIQRDFGDRTNRKHARLKYTIDDRGIDWFKTELEKRMGWKLKSAKPYVFESTGDRYGWVKGTDNSWHLTLYIPGGRIKDSSNSQLKTALREIAEIHKGDFRFTPNQNIIIGKVKTKDKAVINKRVKKYNLIHSEEQNSLAVNSLACVALPTCGLAMANAEQYLPDLLQKIDNLMIEKKLENEPVTIRMTGCPNGCARPYNSEIGFVGKAIGKYNLYLGGSFTGERMNQLYRENINEEEILSTLEPIFERYAGERKAKEHFGDFVIRTGYVNPTNSGKDFHSDSI